MNRMKLQKMTTKYLSSLLFDMLDKLPKWKRNEGTKDTKLIASVLEERKFEVTDCNEALKRRQARAQRCKRKPSEYPTNFDWNDVRETAALNVMPRMDYHIAPWHPVFGSNEKS